MSGSDMGRAGVIVSVIAVGVLVALPSYSAWSTVETCTRRADAILAAADPLDRDPPQRVATVVREFVPVDRLPALLSSILLERFACRSGERWAGTEWLIDHPALTWRLRETFDDLARVSLFASTADMGKGDIGLSRGAQRIYKKDISEVDDHALRCLVRRALGMPTGYIWPTDRSTPPPPPNCAQEFALPRVF